MGIGESVCLSTIHFRVERVVAHGHSREDGWSMRHLVSDVVDYLSVMMVGKASKRLTRSPVGTIIIGLPCQLNESAVPVDLHRRRR
jgi:hypothetical protein